MSQDTLVRRLDEFVGRAKGMVRERDEVIARIPSLQREASELRNLICLAESKVDEMLKDRPTPEASRRLEELGRRFPAAFTLD